MAHSIPVHEVATAPIAGQKTGTSGLRKKTAEFRKPHYLANWIQSLLLTLMPDVVGSTLVVGGDGRFWNDAAVDIIARIAAANGVAKLLVGRNAILSTPAVSSIIRRRHAFGGIILTASHNPGGENADFGIKYNSSNGGPAPESITDKIFVHTESITSYKIAGEELKFDLANTGSFSFDIESVGKFEVDVIDSIDDYEQTLAGVFDFDAIRSYTTRADVKFKFDSLHGVTGPYARHIFTHLLGVPESAISHGDTLPDFGGLHPDPNLTYAEELVHHMYSGEYDFGGAWDGDGDRNMILGNKFFVTPSDSVAIIAAYAKLAIPYFAAGVTAVARSMPTSAALDRVAEKLGLKLYEVPTGWKFFGSIMDHYEAAKTPNVICGEESFGTGSDHVREKDGIWATLAWLSILAYRNREPGSRVTVADIVHEHWREYGRNYYSRYDYEEVDAQAAKDLMAHLVSLQADAVGKQLGPFTVAVADEFSYEDPYEKSVTNNQGIRFIFSDGSRFVFRLSGTGSSGATIRLYLEQYKGPEADHSVDTQVALKDLISVALELSQIERFTGRNAPTVIT